jgi:Txe/YoeB family toxin of Txe-Axe toxin-antitoxin module
MAFGPRARRIVFASLLALVLVAVTAFLARNAIATAAARTVASRLLGVNVEIDAVKLDLLGLGVDVNGLRVDNPKGWGTPRALDAGHIGVNLSGESTTKELVVDHVELDRVKIWFIKDGDRNNMSELIGNLSTKPAEGAPKPEPAKGDGTELVIRRLTLTDVEVHYTERNSIVGDIPVAARLERIEVRDIRARTAGKDLAEQLVGQVFEATVLAIVNESGGKLPAALGGAIGDSVKAGGRIGAQAVDAMGKAAEGAVKGAGDAVGGLMQGIGDAISGKKNGGK